MSFLSHVAFQLPDYSKKKVSLYGYAILHLCGMALGTEIHQAPVSPEFSNVISLSLSLFVRLCCG